MRDDVPHTTVFRLLTITLILLAHAGQTNAEPAPPPPANPTLQGKVLDPTGSPIPGATVVAGTGNFTQSVSTHSGSAGEFVLWVKPGAWTLTVAADGFTTATKAVEAGPGAELVEVRLQVAPRAEMVTVTETANYQILSPMSTRTPVPLRDVPQSISVVTQNLIRDQGMQNMADVVRYVPGITMAQGEGHRDAPVIRGNATTADFYVNGVRDDVQYYRDLYNVERVEAVKGANALTFGRGGGGGVINRVTKDAQFFPVREIFVQGGSFGNKRISSDFGHSFGEIAAFRLNTMYENSDSFRHNVNLERYGIAPAMTLKAGDRTQIRFAYERFDDGRVVDRGIPSFQGAPLSTSRSTYFGNPDRSNATADVNVGSATLEHQMGYFNLRNSFVVGDYEKFYANVFPGSVNADRTMVSISGYNNRTERRNLFNQTDVTGTVTTGRLRHTLLMGTEFGRQRTFNFRNTGYFNNGNATSISVPLDSPETNAPVIFRQSATDADNRVTNNIGAVYVQDQMEVSRYVQVVAGLRYDYFNLHFLNQRNSERLSRRDDMVSPRAALVVKPVDALSVYTSYSVSYLPSSGDQFSSLNATTQTLRPEKFTNYEVGAKWDAARAFAVTAAAYRLNRTNTTARDPNDPARIVQTGSQASEGFELGVNGNITRRLRTVGGYAWQNAEITSATTAAAMGARVALVPKHSFSLWNNYSVSSRLAMGLGLIHQTSMFAGIDNTVRLPGFTRADLGVFYSLTEMLRLQANVENLLDRTYYPTAHSNNNIMPGSPRAVRAGLIARF